MKREDAKQLAAQALANLKEQLQAGRSDTLREYLEVVARFHQYSWNNCLLIAFQMPEATLVAGFHRWRQQGRRVRKGEKGIGILAPLAYRRKEDALDPGEEHGIDIRGFRVVYVFDVSQTEGEELPQFAAISGEPGGLLPQLESLIRRNGIVLEDQVLPIGTKGCSLKGKIYIAVGLPSTERFAVLVHELAHEWMHDEKCRQETTRTARETEAEATAYVVCRAFGLDCSTRSSDYIQLYQGSETTLADSLARIQKTATRIIRLLDPRKTNPDERQRPAA